MSHCHEKPQVIKTFKMPYSIIFERYEECLSSGLVSTFVSGDPMHSELTMYPKTLAFSVLPAELHSA